MTTGTALQSAGLRDITADTSLKQISGVERTSILLLALGPENGAQIWKSLDDDEIRLISQTLSKLGKVASEVVERLIADFIMEMGRAGALVGNFEATEQLLMGFLAPERVTTIMEEIRGPAGRNMWEKLSNVQENVLASYLKNEYPQTIAVVLSKIKSETASRVLAILPEELSLDVVSRMLRMESIQKDILDKIEQTLKTEFMSNLSQTQRRDAHEQIADIFNSFDRQTESRFMSALEEVNRESADRIKQLMFTFEDLSRLDAASVQTLLRTVEKDKLALALKGSTETIQDFFFGNMSQRAAKMLKEDMEVMGPVRLRDVDEAQSSMVNLAKDLAAKGEIMITKNRNEDELIY